MALVSQDEYNHKDEEQREDVQVACVVVPAYASFTCFWAWLVLVFIYCAARG